MTLTKGFFRSCLEDEDDSNSTSRGPLSLERNREITIIATSRDHGQGANDRDGLNQIASSLDETPRHTMSWMFQCIFKGLENGYSKREIQYRETIALNYDADKKLQKKRQKYTSSPLKIATMYKSMDDIPSIALEEVVMPHSPLQTQMANRMREKGIMSESAVDECVVCMEEFDDSNPRIPTKCGCGENNTFFHLPCLYQWIDTCKECPSCRRKLTWKEF